MAAPFSTIGRYQVLAELGQGAMGAVYRAHDPLMDRPVAIKMILSLALAGPHAAEYRERFFREARAAGRMNHPGIVTIYDVGEQDGASFIVMEFIEGRSLESALNAGARFTQAQVCDLGQQIAEALAYAHHFGVIHRDIKPANIMLTSGPGLPPDSVAKITDFGVAKLNASQLTMSGRLLGTPAFMSPEQCRGQEIDGRSDLFSLGVILYWMATGCRPFQGDSIASLSYNIVFTQPEPPRSLNGAVSPEFERVILRCLIKDPQARYATGTEVAAELRTLRELGDAAKYLTPMSAPTEAVAPSTVRMLGRPVGDPVPSATPTTPEAVTIGSQPTVVDARPSRVSTPRSPEPAGPPLLSQMDRGTSSFDLPAPGRASTSDTAEDYVPGARSTTRRGIRWTWVVSFAAVAVLAAVVSLRPRQEAGDLAANQPPAGISQPSGGMSQPLGAPDASTTAALASKPAPSTPPASGGSPPKRPTPQSELEAAMRKEELDRQRAALDAQRMQSQNAQKSGSGTTPPTGAPASSQHSAAQPGAQTAGGSATGTAQPKAPQVQMAQNTTASQPPTAPPKQAESAAASPPSGSSAAPASGGAGSNTSPASKQPERAAAQPPPASAAPPPASVAKSAPSSGAASSPAGKAPPKRDPNERPSLFAGQGIVRIEVENLPGSIELQVILDGEPLFRRPAAAAAAFGTATFTQEKQVPAGRRSFQVVVLSPVTGKKSQKSLRGEWKPGQQRALRIELGNLDGDGVPKLSARLD